MQASYQIYKKCGEIAMQEIKLNEIENIKIGAAQDFENGTGCSVIICENGMAAGIDVRGGGPASRETQLLSPVAAAEKIHAVLLSGGSAFGLDAAGGVMKYLEEKNIGFDTGIAKVPLVCQSCIFDLGVANSKIRPDKQMGYDACVNAEQNNHPEGCNGVGTGATVGKYRGGEFAMKSGVGMYAVQIGALKVGAIVAVNALGDVLEDGKIIAGLLSKNKDGFLNTEEEMYKDYSVIENMFTANTTIGAVITNAEFTKTQLTKIASLTHNGYARSISPVHTMADGDTVYALSVGNVKADLNIVGTLAARVVSQAIVRAVKSAEPMYGFKAYRDIQASSRLLDKQT